MAVNDGIAGRVADPFPGISLPAGTGAAGSATSRDDGPQVGAPVVTGPYDSAQGELARVGVAAGDTAQGDPAANTAITPGGPGYVSTGAGGGHADHWPREPWQQRPGGAP